MLLTLGLILTIPVFQTPTFTRYSRPLPGLHIVKPIPSELVAGSTYEWVVSFVNPQSKSSLMNLTLEITEEKTVIGFGEFRVECTLESYDNPQRHHHNYTLMFTETSGGTFQSLQKINEKFNFITFKISSVSNLMPGKYAFTLNITITH
jgi:hypothetical protein